MVVLFVQCPVSRTKLGTGIWSAIRFRDQRDADASLQKIRSGHVRATAGCLAKLANFAKKMSAGWLGRRPADPGERPWTGLGAVST